MSKLFNDDEVYENDAGGQVSSSGFSLLPEGQYDYAVHGIVLLGMQPQSFEGKEKEPCGEVKVIYELPRELRDDGQTQVVSAKFALKANERAGYTMWVRTVVTADDEDMKKLITTRGMQILLGKYGVLTYKHWEKEGKENGAVDKKGFYPLDPRVLKGDPMEAKRETFLFNPHRPDMKIWNETLTFYTKKQVMESLSVAEFPDELKQQWAKDQEDQAAKEAERKKGGKTEVPFEAAPGATMAIE